MTFMHFDMSRLLLACLHLCLDQTHYFPDLSRIQILGSSFPENAHFLSYVLCGLSGRFMAVTRNRYQLKKTGSNKQL